MLRLLRDGVLSIVDEDRELAMRSVPRNAQTQSATTSTSGASVNWGMGPTKCRGLLSHDQEQVDSHLMTRTCVAQGQVWRAQRTFHIISCVIFMRSCCVFDSPRHSLFLLSTFRPIVFHFPSLQLLHPGCEGQLPCALPLSQDRWIFD